MAETMIEVRDLTKHFGAVEALCGVLGLRVLEKG